MRSYVVSLLALAATGSAQMMNLEAALASSSQLSNLTRVLSSFPEFTAGLANATNVTILAPSNAAFDKLANSSILSAISSNDSSTLEALINYHVLNGTYNSSQIMQSPSFISTHLTNMMYANITGGQRVEALNASGNITFYSGLLSNSSVSQADVKFSGGIIHIIDTFLTPPANISSSAEALGLSSAVGALQQAMLATALDSAMDITAFVPMNDAFQSIGSALINASMSELTELLEYHVVNGTVAYSSNVMNETVKTMQGNNLTLRVENGTIYVNQAKVIIPNVLVSNGVVHVIDGVLNPNATSMMPNTNPTATVASGAFSGASSATMAPFTSGIPTPSTTIAIPSAATAAAAAGAGGGSGMSSSSSGGAAKATQMAVGAIGAGALFAGAWMGV